jgi:curved DNA-binding protein CbpA
MHAPGIRARWGIGVSSQSEALQGTPRLAPGCDPTKLALDPGEGFLLSRIDGQTPWALLREMGGLPPEQVDRCVERWLGEGILELRDAAATERPRAPRAATNDADAELDPTLELAVETQQRILEFERRLSLPYHELLGVGIDPDPKAVKRAYFRLSREFHPDRFFRRNLGPFAAKLERIFRKVLEAHELLSDPVARAELQRSLAVPAEAEPCQSPGQAPVAAADARRRLASFTAHAKVLRDRQRKAKHYFETGMAAFRAERWLEAAASVRLALAFDPRNEAHREAFGQIQQKAHEVRAVQLVREAEAALDIREYSRALTAFEECLQFRPHDADLHHRAARLAQLAGGDLRKAKEWAALACELAPDEAPYRRTLGQIYKAAGLDANARRELHRALELDPRDEESRAELAGLGRR